jgi:ATP-dependent DNA helicase RecG
VSLTLNTPIVELYRHKVGHLTAPTAGKLAAALAPIASKTDVAEVTVADLLNYFPTRYEDRSNFITVDKLQDGMEAAVEIYVRNAGGKRVGKNRDPRKPPLFIFEVTGGDADRRYPPVQVKWFFSGRNASQILEWYEKRFARGTRFVAYGLWETDARGVFYLKITKPEELEILPVTTNGEVGLLKEEYSDETSLEQDIANPEFTPVHTARRVPIYRKLGPFQTKRLREIMHDVLAKLDRSSIKDDLPAELIERNNLATRAQALAEIHFPPDDSLISEYEMYRSAAQRRLIFEEFFWLSFSMQLIRGQRQKEPKGAVIEVTGRTREHLTSLLPFALTDAQKRVIGEIFADLKGEHPMNRLIQGDVGSGKTIVAFLAMFAAMENGYQAALMAPTEILAEQHLHNALRIFDGTGYSIEMLVGSMPAARKRKVQERIANGEIHMVIGTQALIQDAVKFDQLGLAVIDEQHRFGVMQRAQLKGLGTNPDILVMTATPIPRSLAMTIYGDLEVSIIDELPPGRAAVKTVVCGDDQRSGVYRGIEREIKLGRQAYVVYPLIEDSAKSDLKAATKMHEDLSKRFRGFRVGLLHGKMKTADKEAIMSDFVGGKIDILVSTTVIEVGVDVSNASLMVIEHAERFGLSQLHQLRGRVGRGAEQSYCVLLTDDKKTITARQRLGIMEQTNDGFKIAEKDLEIRGQGEILGTRQSGLQSFQMANIVRDLDILTAARREAEDYLTKRRLSPETAALIKASRNYKKVGLANI